MNVLVTGVGGGVGQSIIKSFQNSSYTVIAADGEVLGTGLYAAPKSYRVPYASSPAFVDRLLEVCRAEKCRLIFPGLDAELPVLARASYRFREVGATPVVSSPNVIDICDDKLETNLFLLQHGFNAPLTVSLSEGITHQVPYPLVLKPRKGGARSKGVFVVSDDDEFSHRIAEVETGNYVAQEYIDGDEFTCGSISLEGRCHGAIVMKRVLRDGDTYKAFVVNDAGLQAYVSAVADALQPFGPCNVQLRVREGKPYVFEINARCSGTTYSRTLAGFNEPVMTADYLLRGLSPEFSIRDISILRYWNELVVENQRINQLDQDGAIDGDGSKL